MYRINNFGTGALVVFTLVFALLALGAGCVFDDDAGTVEDRPYSYDGDLPDGYDTGLCLWASEIQQGASVEPPAYCCELGRQVAQPNSCLSCKCGYNVAGTAVWRCTYAGDACNFEDAGDTESGEDADQ